MNDSEMTPGAWGVREALHSREIAAKDEQMAELQRQIDARDGRLAALGALAGRTPGLIDQADAREAGRSAHRAMVDRVSNAWKPAGGAAAR